MKKIAIVISSPMMVNFFLTAQLNYLSKQYDVTLITGYSDNNVDLIDEIILSDIKIIRINMERKISIFSDLVTFCKLVKIFYLHNFDLVHSISPKSGLLAQLAAFLLGIKIRLHTFTGQVWATKSGLWRFILKFIDITIVKMSSVVLVDSYSQRSFLMSENVLNHDNSKVLLNGSISGINEQRFSSSIQSYKSFREQNQLNLDCKIILFIGRLTKDKGVIHLIKAFEKISKKQNECYLLLVGPDEDNIIRDHVEASMSKSKIMYFEYTNTPEYYMQVSDILCLPSLREGFGNVVLEAAMCGIPSVVSDIYGLRDVIENKFTALTFPAGNIDLLTEKLIQLIQDNRKLLEMGHQANKRAKYLYSKESINHALALFYEDLIDNI